MGRAHDQTPCESSSQLYLFPIIPQRRRSIHRWSLTLSVSHNALTLYLSETGTSPPGSEDFDELLMEKRGVVYWIHFAVRPFGNRRHTNFKK